MSGEPFPKASQLARGERRYRRRVASPKQWQAIREAKIGPCRVCCDPATNGRLYGRIQLHHLLSRAQGGDDVVENIVPLCPECHERVTRRCADECLALADNLEDGEYAYLIGKLGEGALERLYGVGR